MFLASSLEFCPSLAPLPQNIGSNIGSNKYYPKVSEIMMGQTVVIEESTQVRQLVFYIESDGEVELILYEGRTKKLVARSDRDGNLGESITKQSKL